MFTTFNSQISGVSVPESPSKDSVSSTSTPSLGIPRQVQGRKRQQVSRACDHCRVYRIKCDNETPCTNCRSKDQQCHRRGGIAKTTSLAKAHHNIDRLEQRVKELELELQNERRAGVKNSEFEPDFRIGRRATRRSSSGGVSGSDAESALFSADYDADGLPTGKFNKGVYACEEEDSSRNTAWYGPASLHYFALRLNRFLELALPKTPSIHNPLVVRDVRPLDEPAFASYSLSPTQEEYFLDLYWQTYHTVFPVVDETDVKEHFKSLWSSSPNKERKASALVDIMLALCIQDATAMTTTSIQPSDNDSAFHDDVAIPRHHRYYQRCRTFLVAELENPTITTLQCQLLCTSYLYSRMLHNTADSTCAHAVRTAYILGLHMDPPGSLSRPQRELRKRIWWSLYVLEAKISLKLGRPFLIHGSANTCPLPSDDYETAVSGSSFAPLGSNATWLTWNLHQAKLFHIARAASTDFYGKDIRCFHRGSKTSMIQSEMCFGILKPHINKLDEWIIDVPIVLQVQRQSGGGRPFSTSNEGLALEIEQFAPLWLHRQRFLLELMYHDICTNLYRPFIPFDAAQHSESRPLTDSAATKCAAHAAALTTILYEVLSKTTILAGFQEALQWQWNAALSLVGFVLAYRESASMAAALSSSREAIATSVTVFNLFAGMDGFSAVAGTAAHTLQGLSSKLTELAAQSRPHTTEAKGNVTDTTTPLMAIETYAATDGDWFASPLPMPEIPDPFAYEDSVMQGFLMAEAEFDLVNALDIYPSFNLVLPGSHMLRQND